MATELDWEKAIGFVLKFEGGKVDDKLDRGGKTCRGVTQRTLDSYRKSKNLNLKDVFNISDSEVYDIYKNNYWKAVNADGLDGPYACVMFDFAVNSSVSRALRYSKLANGNISKLIQMRREFYKKIVKNDPTQQKFLKGWLRRIDELEKYVAAWDLIKF